MKARHAIAPALLLVLYVSVAMRSWGFDDEMFSIAVVESHSLAQLLNSAGYDHAHPPGAYLLNAVLYLALQDWSYVRVVSAGLIVAAVSYLLAHLRRESGPRTELIAIVLLGLSPTLLLWCTSLRWYGYFLPLLIWLMVPPRGGGPWHYWGKLAVGLVALAYLNYSALLMAIPLFLLYFRSRPDPALSQARVIATLGACGLVLYLPQLFVLAPVLADAYPYQVGSLGRSLGGYLVGVGANHGLFPLSPGGLASVAGWTIVGAVLFRRFGMRGLVTGSHASFFALASLLLVVSGLAAKVRNTILLVPTQMAALASAQFGVHDRALRIGATLIGAANVIGCYNVVVHEDTIKANWNLPDPTTVRTLVAQLPGCGGAGTVVLTHDPVYSYHFLRAGLAVVSPYVSRRQARDEATCVAVLLTNPGSIETGEYSAMMGEVERLGGERLGIQRLAWDRYHAVKQYLDPRYPSYGLEIRHIGHASGLQQLNHWAGDARAPHWTVGEA